MSRPSTPPRSVATPRVRARRGMGGAVVIALVTHIPSSNGHTFCGRVSTSVRCIDIQRDCIEDASCKSCQRSDDRRTRELHIEEA
jgi:hypothetical protein